MKTTDHSSIKATQAHQAQHHRTAYMTVSQAAKHMGVGKKIIYQLFEFGELQAVRNRGAILVEKASLDDFRNSGRLT